MSRKGALLARGLHDHGGEEVFVVEFPTGDHFAVDVDEWDAPDAQRFGDVGICGDEFIDEWLFHRISEVLGREVGGEGGFIEELGGELLDVGEDEVVDFPVGFFATQDEGGFGGSSRETAVCGHFEGGGGVAGGVDGEVGEGVLDVGGWACGEDAEDSIGIGGVGFGHIAEDDDGDGGIGGA